LTSDYVAYPVLYRGVHCIACRARNRSWLNLMLRNMTLGTLQVLLNYALAFAGLIGSFILLLFGKDSGIDPQARLAFATTL